MEIYPQNVLVNDFLSALKTQSASTILQCLHT